VTSSIEGCSGAFWNGEMEERIEIGSGNNIMETMDLGGRKFFTKLFAHRLAVTEQAKQR
jgi:hypothetical protein